MDFYDSPCVLVSILARISSSSGTFYPRFPSSVSSRHWRSCKWFHGCRRWGGADPPHWQSISCGAPHKATGHRNTRPTGALPEGQERTDRHIPLPIRNCCRSPRSWSKLKHFPPRQTWRSLLDTTDVCDRARSLAITPCNRSEGVDYLSTNFGHRHHRRHVLSASKIGTSHILSITTCVVVVMMEFWRGSPAK